MTFCAECSDVFRSLKVCTLYNDYLVCTSMHDCFNLRFKDERKTEFAGDGNKELYLDGNRKKNVEVHGQTNRHLWVK